MTASPSICYIKTTETLSARGDLHGQSVFCLRLFQLLAGTGCWWAWDSQRERKCTHLLPGFSRSRSLRTDLPSTSGGGSSPAMSRMVGARSMFRTICGTLQRDRWLRLKPNTSGRWHLEPLSAHPDSLAFCASPLASGPLRRVAPFGQAGSAVSDGTEQD